MNQNEIVITVLLIILAVVFVVILAAISGVFDQKIKCYEVDTIKRTYYDVPGVKPCNKCGQEKCNIVMNVGINGVGIYKKEVRFRYGVIPMFYIECPKCGCRSKEANNLGEAILAWNMDSRFQIDDNE